METCPFCRMLSLKAHREQTALSAAVCPPMLAKTKHLDSADISDSSKSLGQAVGIGGAKDATEASIAAARSERFELRARRNSGVCFVIASDGWLIRIPQRMMRSLEARQRIARRKSQRPTIVCRRSQDVGKSQAQTGGVVCDNGSAGSVPLSAAVLVGC